MTADATNVWIIVPAYQEEERLADALHGLTRCYPHVVVVDDGSTDHTADVAREFPVWLVRHPFNLGQGAALGTGLEFALRQGAEILVTFDADGQHRVEDIRSLVEPIRQGRCDVSLGSRFLAGGSADRIPRLRRWVLRIAVLFTRIVSRIRVTDTHNGLRAFSRQAALGIRITEDGMAHASEILDRVRERKLRYVEAPVTIRYTPETLAKGQSSWNALRIAGEFLLGRMIR